MKSISYFLRIPAPCALCQTHHLNQHAVCERCHALIKPVKQACSLCKTPLPDNHKDLCGGCIKEKPFFDEVICHHMFEEPLRELLHRFKYHQAIYLTSYLSSLMTQKSSNVIADSDCLVPVPVHCKRLQKRGYNHALELTKKLSGIMKKPLAVKLCEKIKHTQPQANMSRLERKKNLKQAFQVQPNTLKHVTIVDDLITTSSTANELAKALKASGIQRVTVWCSARATIRTHTAANHSSPVES